MRNNNLKVKRVQIMKKWSRKKMIMLLVLLIIIGGIMLLYNSFNGNFIGKTITKARVNKYIGKTYREKDFEIYDMYYDFKFGGYGAKVKSDKDGLDFTIESFRNGRIYDEYKESSYLAYYELENKFSKVIEDELKREFKDILKFDTDVIGADYLFARVIVKQGKYRGKVIEYNKKMDDFIEITVSTQSKEKAIDVAKKMKEVLVRNDYNGFKLFAVSYYENDIPYVIALEREDLSSNKEIEEFLRKGIVNFNPETGTVEFQESVMSKEEELEKYNQDSKIKD